jgi:hypothetical protein
MPWAGFETTIPAFEGAKAVHALDPAGPRGHCDWQAFTITHFKSLWLLSVGQAERILCVKSLRSLEELENNTWHENSTIPVQQLRRVSRNILFVREAR